MPVYEYKALDGSGKGAKGIINADTAFMARQQLRSAGLFPVAIDESSSGQKKANRGPAFSSLPSRRIKPGEVSTITRQLSTLTGAGVTLIASINALISQTPNPLLKKILAEVKESVNEGNSLAASLSGHPRVFSQVYVGMVRAGEASGSLDIVLDRLADFSEHQQALRGRFEAALAYPVFMFAIGALILFFLISFVVPDITKIFAEMNQALPLPTLALISISKFFEVYWWLLLSALAGGIILTRRLINTLKGRRIWDRLRVGIPVLGQIHLKRAVARFGATLGSLLQSGVPLLNALKITREIVDNILIAETVDQAMEAIREGEGLDAPLARSRWFPPVALQMISVGLQSGDLEGMLYKIADTNEREVDARITALTSMLEPVMILVMGLAVGFIVVSILLPIFEMNQIIG